MTFLIDGYNLMFAVGYAHKGMAAGELARGRTRLLDWIADRRGDRADAVRVVFDAVSGKRSPESTHRGLTVRFADRQTADDEIEQLIRAAKRPHDLAVVSNDGRIQEAARRRKCRVFECAAFLDWLDAAPPPQPAEEAGEVAAEPPSPDEMAAWLAAFSKPKKR